MVFDLLKSYLKSYQLFVSLMMQDSLMKIVIGHVLSTGHSGGLAMIT